MKNKNNDLPQNWSRIRQLLIPPIGRLATTIREQTGLDVYAMTQAKEEEFVGLVPHRYEKVEQILYNAGLEINVVSSLKHLGEGTNDVGDASWRLIGVEGEPRMQLHVILFDTTDMPSVPDYQTHVYAHWEYRWDTDPWKHYRGKRLDIQKGVSMTREILRRNGVSYDATRPTKYSRNV